MKVQEVLLENQSKRYILLDYAGLPVLPVIKDFLYHVNKDKPSIRNILKIKGSHKILKTITKEQVQQANLFI